MKWSPAIASLLFSTELHIMKIPHLLRVAIGFIFKYSFIIVSPSLIWWMNDLNCCCDFPFVLHLRLNGVLMWASHLHTGKCMQGLQMRCRDYDELCITFIHSYDVTNIFVCRIVCTDWPANIASFRRSFSSVLGRRRTRSKVVGMRAERANRFGTIWRTSIRRKFRWAATAILRRIVIIRYVEMGGWWNSRLLYFNELHIRIQMSKN